MAQYRALTVFTATSIPLIYTGLAFYDTYEAHKSLYKIFKVSNKPTYQQLTRSQLLAQQFKYYPRPDFEEFFNARDKSKYVEKLSPTTQLGFSIIALNSSIHALKMITPIHQWGRVFMHIPLSNRRFTLATCLFGHASLTHLGFNMFTLNSFMPILGASNVFKESQAHLLAFYLTAGIASSYAQILNCKIRPDTLRSPFLGASGAIFAIMGAYTVQYPQSHFNIFFIPIAISAPKLMGALMAFDAYGVVKGYTHIRFGHAAHLSGALIGMGYVYFEAAEKLWKPLGRFIYEKIGVNEWS